jgi:predicted transglutaminase-like cysteine proteinase
MMKYAMKALLLNAVLASCCAAQGPVPVPPIRQDLLFCETAVASVFCNTDSSSIALSVTGNSDPFVEMVTLANNTVKRNFTVDTEAKDVWVSFGEQFINDQTLLMKGDCEDFAMTTIEYAIHMGIPKNRLARAIVISDPNSTSENAPRRESHMVAVYHSVETNQYYYFGDTFSRRVNLTSRSGHDPVYIDWLSDGYSWLKIDRVENSRMLENLVR